MLPVECPAHSEANDPAHGMRVCDGMKVCDGMRVCDGVRVCEICLVDWIAMAFIFGGQLALWRTAGTRLAHGHHIDARFC